MGAFFQDLRFAFRALRKAPGFVAATIITLALGIGANSAIFSVVNGLLLRPLPYERSAELISIFATDAAGRQRGFSQPDLDDFRASSKTLVSFASFVSQSVSFTGRDEPERIVGLFGSANFLSTLGVAPALGRAFLPGEDRPGAALAAILSDRFWQRRFGGDRSVSGRTFNFNGEPYTVIGVLPAGFSFAYGDFDVMLPAFKYPNYSQDRAAQSCMVLGRRRPDVKLEAVRTELSGIAAQLATAYPASNRDRGVKAQPFQDLVVDDLRPIVSALAGAVAFVLLIGCANVACLLITRMVGRERERTIRIALGASRARLVSYVLSETLILASAGGLLALAITAWSVPVLAGLVAPYFPPGVSVKMDASNTVFTLGIALATALLVAAIPAWQGSRRRLGVEMRGAGAGARRNLSRRLLVAGEIAMALVLLAGAGLMFKTLLELSNTTPGFDPRNLLSLEYRLPRAKYPAPAAQAEFHRQVIEKIRQIPGVIGATSVRAVPLGGNGMQTDFSLTDRPEPKAAQRPHALLNFADSYFFETMRIPVLRGRVFTEHDQIEQPPVVVINQTLARRYFDGRDPVGQTLHIAGWKRPAEIIGVAGDVKQFSISDQPAPQIYGALAQSPFIFTSVAVRTAGDPEAMAPNVRHAIQQLDRDQPIWNERAVEKRIESIGAPSRFVTGMLAAYSALALLLACSGIFGVVAYSVSQRTSEIGIRIALGARPGQIGKLILREGVAMTAGGVVAGLAAAAWLTRYLQTQLYAVRPIDPAVYAIVAVALALVMFAACLVPARRAVRIDPVEALRHE